MQDDLTFSDTVANNIGVGNPEHNLPQIIEAAKLAHASKRFWGGQYAFIGKTDSRRSYALASIEMQELYTDVTERAEVPAT